MKVGDLVVSSRDGSIGVVMGFRYLKKSRYAIVYYGAEYPDTWDIEEDLEVIDEGG